MTSSNTDSKNFAIGLLSTTAVILLVGLIIVQSRPDPAMASGMTAVGGDYVLTVGSVQTTSNSIEELLYVVDAGALRLGVYNFDAARKQIELTDGVDLKEMRQATAKQAQPQQPTKPRGRRGRP